MNALYWPSFINYQLLLPYRFRLGHILAMDALQSKKYDSISLFMVAVIPLLFCCSTIYLTISNQFLISLPIGLFGGDKNKSMYQTIVYMVAICQLIQMVFFWYCRIFDILFNAKHIGIWNKELSWLVSLVTAPSLTAHNKHIQGLRCCKHIAYCTYPLSDCSCI